MNGHRRMGVSGGVDHHAVKTVQALLNPCHQFALMVRLAEIDFLPQTFGCGAAVATSSMATELVKGKNIQEAMEVTNKAVMEALDGLPPVKVHCSLLAEEGIHAALWDYAEKNGIVIEGLKKPKNDISEGEEEEEY